MPPPSSAETASTLDERGVVTNCPSCGRRNRLPYARLGQAARCSECRAELPAPAAPIDVASEAVFDRLINASALPVLVDFWAPWCGPCKMVAPEIAKVAAENAGRWIVAKVDTQALPSFGPRFGIQGIPLLAVFQGGREIARKAGAMPAPLIRRFMDQAF